MTAIYDCFSREVPASSKQLPSREVRRGVALELLTFNALLLVFRLSLSTQATLTAAGVLSHGMAKHGAERRITYGRSAANIQTDRTESESQRHTITLRLVPTSKCLTNGSGCMLALPANRVFQ